MGGNQWLKVGLVVPALGWAPASPALDVPTWQGIVLAAAAWPGAVAVSTKEPEGEASAG